jgi:hypothetical protein
MWLWIPSAAPVALLLILFPTGRLTSRRFRPVLWIGATGVAVATIATALNAPAADDQFGNVILSALPIREAHGVFLPKPTSAMRRSFLRSVIDIGGGHSVTVVEAHLEGGEPALGPSTSTPSSPRWLRRLSRSLRVT